jgi:hypothetical protein
MMRAMPTASLQSLGDDAGAVDLAVAVLEHGDSY